MNQAEILLIEDNEGDVFLTKKAFAKAGIEANIEVAEDGEQALQRLQGQEGFEHAKRPSLVLLDINLPKKDGWQVLKEMKADPVLRQIPVIILSSSHLSQDVQAAYELHASSYIVKPASLDRFHDIVSALGKFWFDVALLPPA